MNKRKDRLLMNLFYLPAMALFLIFVIYPLAQGVFLSFTNWNGYSQSYKMVGFNNFIHLFNDKNVLTAFLNTLIYGFGSTLLQNMLGLALALFLNQKFPGRWLGRTFVYLPVMIAPLIMGYIMYFFVSFGRGALNDILLLLHAEKVDWMANGLRAVFIMTLINALQFVGVSMVIYLAGLQNIPAMYYEAAAMDGMGNWGRFRYVTVPMLIPAVASAVVINLIGGLKLFDIIMALTSGGPGYSSHSLSTLIHRTYFGSENAGYASAIGLMAFLFIIVVSNIFVRMFEKKEVVL
jgi:raffinose/stachyose/melibiose transport system permease protein